MDDSIHCVRVHILCSSFIEGTEGCFGMLRINGEYILLLLGSFAKLRNQILVSSCLFVCLSFCLSVRLFVCSVYPSARNSSPSARILMKFDIDENFRKSVEKIQV